MRSANSCGAIPAQPTAYLLSLRGNIQPRKMRTAPICALGADGKPTGAKPVQIPKVGAGPFVARVQGTYPARDGEIFECVDPLHAEVFAVFRGLSVRIMVGQPRRRLKMNRCSREFLAGSRIFREQSVSVLEKELALVSQYRRVDTARPAALRELLERTQKGKRAASTC
jgi:hypothetical protein